VRFRVARGTKHKTGFFLDQRDNRRFLASFCGGKRVLDAQWIQRLHSDGLLQPSFRPADSILALRGYHRQRQLPIRSAASHTQHRQRALEQMNVKLTEVVSDITGLTGQRIIAAILTGECEPRGLAAMDALMRLRFTGP